MAKVTILGGCGVVGTAALKTLANTDDFSDVVIADINLERANELADELGNKVSAVKVDANDTESIKKAISGSDVVINTIGPYYKYEKNILSTVIQAGINYVDVNDDTGATYDALSMDEDAKKANVLALIGMGSSPGVTNLLAAYAANDLLAECDSIDMYHAHGGEPTEGPGVIGHRFYCLSQDIPVFINGESKEVSQSESAQLEEEIEFINLEGKHRVYPYPHPEPITLPMFIKDRGLRRVTNKGTVLPHEYYSLTRKIHSCGLDSKEAIDVKGQKVIPYDFAISYLIKKRDEILEQTNFGEQRGCVKIVCKGRKKERRKLVGRTYIFSLVSEGAGKGQALGEGTGIPCAFGAILMQRGVLKGKGVLPPEACVNPMNFIQLMREVLRTDESVEEKKSPVIFESIDDNGNIKRMEF
ncbi:MAG: NAD(P)H-binding protein [Candidatus Lokiarchaeota archaeon]|nr:NAD(P)H-binding protein [Candidatus Lokiarchaeota archaeon]